MKEANKPETIIILGDKNKVSFGGKSKFPTIAIAATAVVVLVVSLSCPDLLADVIQWILQHCK